MRGRRAFASKGQWLSSAFRAAYFKTFAQIAPIGSMEWEEVGILTTAWQEHNRPGIAVRDIQNIMKKYQKVLRGIKVTGVRAATFCLTRTHAQKTGRGSLHAHEDAAIEANRAIVQKSEMESAGAKDSDIEPTGDRLRLGDVSAGNAVTAGRIASAPASTPVFVPSWTLEHGSRDLLGTPAPSRPRHKTDPLADLIAYAATETASCDAVDAEFAEMLDSINTKLDEVASAISASGADTSRLLSRKKSQLRWRCHAGASLPTRNPSDAVVPRANDGVRLLLVVRNSKQYNHCNRSAANRARRPTTDSGQTVGSRPCAMSSAEASANAPHSVSSS